MGILSSAEEVESGIMTQTQSIPVHSRVILQSGEPFLEGVGLIKNDWSQFIEILAEETPEGLLQIPWKIIVKSSLKDRFMRLIWPKGGALQKGFPHRRKRRDGDEEDF